MIYRIKNCKLISGSSLVDGCFTYEIKDGVSRILDGSPSCDKELDGGGALLLPAFTDIGPKLFDPRYPFRDTEQSSSYALSAGGYRKAVVFPENGIINRHVDPRVTYALPITSPDEIAVSGKKIYYGDSGSYDTAELYEIMSAIKESGSLYISSGIDKKALGGGALSSGTAAKMLGCEPISRTSECAEISKELFIAYETGAKLHINAISCRESLESIKNAKKMGAKVSCAVSPFHLAFVSSDVAFYGSNGKLLPPLRTKNDRDILREGVFDGSIDCICSLHTPLSKTENDQPVKTATFGACGIETAFSSLITYMPELLNQRPSRIAELMSTRPAEIIGENVSLDAGSSADFVLADVRSELVVTVNTLKSKSANTPFLGQSLTGFIKALYIGGVQS